MAGSSVKSSARLLGLKKWRAKGRAAWWFPLFGLTLACSAANKEAAAGEEAFYPDEGEDSTADKHYKVAVGSFHNGLFSDARIQLQRALAADEKHGPSRYLEGLLFLRDGKTMLDAVEGEMCLRDESADQQRDRIDSLHRDARTSFSAAVESFDERAAGRGRALNSMSVISLYFHEYDRAVQEAEGALTADFYSERFSALANLGWAYYQRGDRVEAMTELRQSVLLNPDFCVARYRLAQVYLDFDMPEQALGEVQRVLSSEHCPIQDARRVQGVAQLRLGDTMGAQSSFEACIAMSPHSCLAHECDEYLELAATAPVASAQ